MTVVVGGGGLIGSALVARLRAGGVTASPASGIPWGNRAAVAEAFDALARSMRVDLERAGAASPWRVVWAAGRAVIPSPDVAHREEVAALSDLLGALSRALGGQGGDILLVSSAGGVHAGSEGLPFDEGTAPAPRSAYGRSKLDQELLVAEAAVRHGWQARIARVANVYGPGQDPLKPQGLVTRLCRAAVLDELVHMYVPATTSRHYLHADDAASLLVRLMDFPATGPEIPMLRIVSAGVPVTVGELVELVGTVAGRPVPVEWRQDESAAQHGLTIALRSRDEAMWLDAPTPLTDGVLALLADMRASAGGTR